MAFEAAFVIHRKSRKKRDVACSRSRSETRTTIVCRVSRQQKLLSNLNAKSFDSAGRARRSPRSGAHRLAALARLALPQRCELCVAPAGGALLCGDCERALPRVLSPVLAVRGCRPLAIRRLWRVCRRAAAVRATIAAFAYAFPADRLLQRIKYQGRLALADWAGGALGDATVAALARRHDGERPDRVVALPLAPSRQRERGFNQAREIAVHVARPDGIAAQCTARTNRRRHAADQAAVGAPGTQRSRRPSPCALR
jgi:predicted amidophosphoribosyltransferase